MKLFRDHFAPDLLEIAGDSGDLSATATRTADGDRIYLKLVNPTGQDVPVQIALRGDFPLLAASMQLVASDSVQAVESNIERTGMTVRLRLPRASVAVITLSRCPRTHAPWPPSPASVWRTFAASAALLNGFARYATRLSGTP